VGTSSFFRRRSGLSGRAEQGRGSGGTGRFPRGLSDVRDYLDDWLDAVVATPGLTSLDLDEARRVLLDDSLRAIEVVREFEGPIVDVGSGGGAPGIPLAVALPDREVTLLAAERRKCEFLERGAPAEAR